MGGSPPAEASSPSSASVVGSTPGRGVGSTPGRGVGAWGQETEGADLSTDTDASDATPGPTPAAAAVASSTRRPSAGCSGDAPPPHTRPPQPQPQPAVQMQYLANTLLAYMSAPSDAERARMLPAIGVLLSLSREQLDRVRARLRTPGHGGGGRSSGGAVPVPGLEGGGGGATSGLWGLFAARRET